MSLPRFTLVYGVGLLDPENVVVSTDTRGAKARASSMRPAASRVKARASSTRPVASSVKARASSTPPNATAPLTVGLWDLGAHLGRLAHVVKVLNARQEAFRFFVVQAAIPAGLVSAPERVIAWAEGFAKHRVTSDESAEMAHNVIANDFFPRAERVRRALDIDYLVGISPQMVAGQDEEGFYWNHFATSRRRTLLTSTYEVREFARKAGRPFEMAVAGICVAQLLVTICARLEYHDATRGCLFDYNGDRSTIVAALREPKIDAECRAKIPLRLRPVADELVLALANYSGPGGASDPLPGGAATERERPRTSKKVRRGVAVKK